MLKAEFRLPGVTLFVRWFPTSRHQRLASTVLNKLPLKKKTLGKKTKPSPEGKRWWTGVALSFTESGMQISKSEVMGAETWWGGGFQPPRCRASEQKHCAPLKHRSGVQAKKQKKTPKHHYLREKVKEVFGLGFFLYRTRMDLTQPQPGAASGVAILPQGAASLKQAGGWALSPASGQDSFGGDTLPCRGDSHCRWHRGEDWHPEGSGRRVWYCTGGGRGMPAEILQPQISSCLFTFFFFNGCFLFVLVWLFFFSPSFFKPHS